MEVAKISETSVRIKTKLGTFVVNPVGLKANVAADAALMLKRDVKNSEVSVEPTTVVFNGPGEYETKGVKLTGFGKGDAVAYAGRMEGMDVFVTKVSTLTKMKDIVQDSQVVILDVDESTIEQNILASFNANVFVLFGTSAAALATSLGKEVLPVSKYSITRDKLPSELEVVVL